MAKERKDIHQEIKEKFGKNKLDDEVFSHQKYANWVDINGNAFEIERVAEQPENIYKEENKHKIEVIKNNLYKLSNKERIILQLIYQGLSFMAISEKLGIKKGSVQIYLQRIKKKMLKAWNEENDN